MSPDTMEEMLSWLDAGKSPLLVQLPEAEYARLRAAWGLPVR
jgi:D-alanyl-D-alanine dipeptidase